MKAFTCEMCGSHDLVKQDDFFVCQYCGTKYSLEDAKKLMVEVSGTVKIDTSGDVENLFILARRARNDRNYKNSEKYYSQILVKLPSNWEANFYSLCFHCFNCDNKDIVVSAEQLEICLHDTFVFIKKDELNLKDRKKIINDLAHDVMQVVKNMISRAIDDYNHQRDYCNTYSKLSNICLKVIRILFSFGDNLLDAFGDDYSIITVSAWKAGINYQHMMIEKHFVRDREEIEKCIDVYYEKIIQYERSYELPKGKNRLLWYCESHGLNTRVIVITVSVIFVYYLFWTFLQGLK